MYINKKLKIAFTYFQLELFKNSVMISVLNEQNYLSQTGLTIKIFLLYNLDYITWY